MSRAYHGWWKRENDRLMTRLALPGDDDGIEWVGRAVLVVALLVAVIGLVTR